jgi:acyl carrier protein
MTISDQTVALLEEATLSTPGQVQEGTSLAGLDGWDSMGMVVFMGLVKEQLGVELVVHDLRGCETPVEVRALVKKVAGS